MASARVDNAENTNYNKFNRLLVEVTGKVLRKLLVTKALIQKPSLHDYLTAPAIQRSLNNIIPRVIKRHQVELIYPQGGAPADIDKWDITLLCAVLTCVGNLTKSEKKDIEEIKSIRNATVGHLPEPRLTNTEFTGYWTDLTKVINSILPRIGDQGFGNDIYSLISFIKRDKDLDPLLATVETWKKDEEDFTPTRALTSVVQLLETHNTATIVGVSGSGKSGIAHHVALELTKQGYTIFPVERAEDILVHGNMAEKQVFVLDDPIGKHEIDFNELKEFERLYAKHVAFIIGDLKIIVTCRKNIVNDKRFKAYKTVIGQSVVDLSAKENQMSENEKLNMLTRYTGSLNITDACKIEITQIKYNNFPLLCKVFASNIDTYESNMVNFFKSPFPIIVEELDTLKQRDKHQYCALILCLVFDKYFDTCHLNEFNRDTSVVQKVEEIMAVCGLPRNEPLVNIQHAYEALTDVYFIKEQTRYRYIHDVLFDAVAFQFGRDYPKEMLKHCSSSFMREHVRTEGIQSDDSFAIKMPKKGYIPMAERLCDDLRNGQFHDVFLNPSLSDNEFVDTFCEYLRGLKELELKSLMFGNSPNLEGFKGLVKELNFRWDERWFTQQYLFFDHIRVIHWVIACKQFKMFKACHTVLGNLAQQPVENKIDETHNYQRRRCYYFLIMFACLSGNIDIFDTLLLDWNYMEIPGSDFTYNFDILHMAIISNNVDLVEKVLCMPGLNVNDLSDDNTTPLWLSAAFGNVKICEHLLEKHGADVSICRYNGESPLFIAAQEGHAECVSVLLKHGADASLCARDVPFPLYIAAQNGHTECVSVLLREGAKVNQCTNDRTSPLQIASQNGHLDCVSLLLKHGAEVNQCKVSSESPLHMAANNGKTRCVSVLIKYGADVSLCTGNGVSPLYVAAERGHTECLSVLLKHGAEVNQCTDTLESPLYTAAENGHSKCVYVLLKHGADVSLCTHTGSFPLIVASHNGHTECIWVLLKHGAKVNQCTDRRFSPLYAAAHEGHTECVSVLLKHGADVSLCAGNGFSPLYVAAEAGQTECLSVLLKHGAEVNQCTDTLESPLYTAAENGHAKCVYVLLKHGADVSQCTDDGLSPLHIAAEHGHTVCASVLLKYGADVNKCDEKVASPLHIATYEGHTECLYVLLKHGADVNKCDETVASPLHIAAYEGHTECLYVLLKHGADVSLCAGNGFSPLHVAAEAGQIGCLSVLLKHGADVNQCTDTLAPPLYTAAENGHTKCVDVLLQHGANVNLCADDGVSPLHIAANGGHIGALSVLLPYYSDINISDKMQYTPLHAACRNSQIECVKVLLQAGAEVNTRATDSGRSPLAEANNNGDTEIATLLIKAGANVSKS